MKTLLDVGCGPGTLTNIAYYEKFGRTYKIYGIDISKQNVIAIKRKWPKGIFLKADAEHIPFADAYFNQIISRHCLEHVGDIDKVLDEIYRVCKPKGNILIAVPMLSFEWAMVKFIPGYVGHHHQRMISGDELEKMLVKRKFVILERRRDKWPMFVIIILLAFISQCTKNVSMEMQTGVFHLSRKKYLDSFLPSSALYRVVVLLLNVLNRLFWFFNYVIPWEIEITARKK